MKTPVRSQHLNKTKLLKKETPTKVFSCKIYDIFKSTYFIEHLRATASELTTNNTLMGLYFIRLKIARLKYGLNITKTWTYYV